MNEKDLVNLTKKMRARIIPGIDRSDAILADLENGIPPETKKDGLFERSVKRAAVDPEWRKKALPFLVKIAAARKEPSLSQMITEIRMKHQEKGKASSKDLEVASRELASELDKISRDLDTKLSDLNRRMVKESNAILDMDIPQYERETLMKAVSRDGREERKRLRTEHDQLGDRISREYHKKYQDLYQVSLPPIQQAIKMSAAVPLDYFIVAVLIWNFLRYISQL